MSPPEDYNELPAPGCVDDNVNVNVIWRRHYFYKSNVLNTSVCRARFQTLGISQQVLTGQILTRKAPIDRTLNGEYTDCKTCNVR